MAVESSPAHPFCGTASVRLRLLGPLSVRRGESPVPLPPSRKVRALLAYLALATAPVPRARLCELLWDVPNDPRGELRWCLSRIRAILNGPDRHLVLTDNDAVSLDHPGLCVDALAVDRAVATGIGRLDARPLKMLAGLFSGDFLDGLEIDRSPAFATWLAAQRRRYRTCHAAILERLVACLPDDPGRPHLDRWLELQPFDPRVHEQVLRGLARHGRMREGEEHLAATIRLFEDEGLDAAGLRSIWLAARRQASTAIVGPPARLPEADETEPATPQRRASLAVMPFAGGGAAGGGHGGVADALAHDIITRLAKLRSLFVIAQGSVFALHQRRVGAEQAGRMLDVDYVVSGALRLGGDRLTVSVELAETRTARIVWAEVFNRRVDDAFLVLDEIGNRIVASIASEIEMLERNRAILKPPSSLDAWEAFHRGLWHIYRFNREDNEQARHFFETAVQLDPTFARAYAGLSFTHWQNAFQGWAPREAEADRAWASAGQSVMVDDRDPAAHWAMGRALWLRGVHDQSITELQRAVELSPNFAQGHYALAFVHSQAGDPDAAVLASDHSRSLSPFDPMLFAMLGARAMALVRLGRFDEAAEWAVKAAARPNAHAQIQAIAALTLALADRQQEAATHLSAVRLTRPDYRLADFFSAMRFAPDGEALFRLGAERVGLR